MDMSDVTLNKRIMKGVTKIKCLIKYDTEICK